MKNPSRWIKQINDLFLNSFSLPYSDLFKLFKDWYGNILNFDSLLKENRDEFNRSWSEFLVFLPAHLRYFLKDLNFDWNRGKRLDVNESFNQIKRGFEVLTPEQLETSVISTTDSLLNTQPEMDYNCNQFLEAAVDLIICHPKRFEPFDLVPPSKKSTFEYPQTQGGGRNLLRDLMDPEKLDAYEELANYLYSDRISIDPDISKEDNGARIALLVEANKVRYLTIQSAYFQTFCRPLQRFLLDEWKRSDFSTMNAFWLQDFMKCFSYTESVKGFHGSADFSDATNLLKPEATKFVIEKILDKLQIDEDYKNKIRDTIGPRHFHLNKIMFVNHPDPILGKRLSKKISKQLQIKYGKIAIQKSGQLMGNPLSFPLLCIINLATYIEAKCSWVFQNQSKLFKNKSYRIQLLRTLLKGELLINGDDAYCGFQTIEEFNQYKLIALKYGLKVNLKTIASFRMAQMNNVLVTKKGPVSYLNLGMYFNNNIKNFKPVTLENLPANAETFDYDKDLKIGYVRDSLSRLKIKKKERLWNISQKLGGLGLQENLFPCMILSRHTKYRILKKYYKSETPVVWNESLFSKLFLDTKVLDPEDRLEHLETFLPTLSKLLLIKIHKESKTLHGDVMRTQKSISHPFLVDDILVAIGNHLAKLYKFRYTNVVCIKKIIAELELDSSLEYTLPKCSPHFDIDFSAWKPEYFLPFSADYYISVFKRLTYNYHKNLIREKEFVGEPNQLSYHTFDYENNFI